MDPDNNLSGRYIKITLKVKGIFKANNYAFKRKKIKCKEMHARLALYYTSSGKKLYLQDYPTDLFKNTTQDRIGIVDEYNEGDKMDEYAGK